MRFLNTHDVLTDLDLGVNAEDGVRLSVDIYRPAGAEKLPAIVVQTAYDNNRLGGEDTSSGVLPSPTEYYRKLAALGFVVAAIDARGRGDSDGVHTPFSAEGADGASVVSWLRTSGHVGGKIGVLGSGYSAYAALATASRAPVDSVFAWSPPALSPETCMPPLVGGVPSVVWYRWLHLKGGRSPLGFDLTNWARVARDADRSDLAAVVGRPPSSWDHWLESPPAVRLDYDEIDAPVLLVSGWFDPGLTSTIGAWMHLRDRRSTELMVGPWGSAAARKAQFDFGGVDWSPTAAVDPIALAHDWFIATLTEDSSTENTSTGEGASNGRAQARLFRTGTNAWTEADASWPAEDAPYVWSLTSESGANTRRGDGVMLEEPTGYWADRFDEFVYNPENPAPWQPSASGEPGLALNSSTLTLDPWFLTRRDDVLCYTSDSFARSRVLSGEPVLRVRIGQDVTHADWIALLEDVFPGGDSSVALALGSASSDVTDEEAQELSPGSLTVRLSPIHHELQPGHTLRLSLTASLWPLFLPRSASEDGRAFSRRRIYHHLDEPSTFTVQRGTRSG